MKWIAPFVLLLSVAFAAKGSSDWDMDLVQDGDEDSRELRFFSGWYNKPLVSTSAPTKGAKGTDAPKGTGAPKDTMPPKGTDAPKATKAPKGSDAPKRTRRLHGLW